MRVPVVVAVVSAASAASVVSVVEGSGVAVIVSSFNCGCLETSTLAVSSPFFFFTYYYVRSDCKPTRTNCEKNCKQGLTRNILSKKC